MNLRRIYITLFFACIAFGLKAQGGCRFHGNWDLLVSQKKSGAANKFEVRKYSINLDLRNTSSKTIKGYTDVTIVSKENGLSTIKLDLQKLTVNKIWAGADSLTYLYNDTALLISLKTPLNTNDSQVVRVEYEGKPQTDKKWGGFYFSGVYAFNLGVGFDANPHNFGRVWFPCVDEFTSRSLYDFVITTDGTNRAMCNGTLVNRTDNFDGSTTWYWQLNTPIPTYLASVAVAPYSVIEDSYAALSGPTPIILAAHPNDTAKMKASFSNLKGAFEGFEKWYGSHRFERVGFNAVPFNGGAMEHATNIAYPLFAIDGTLSQETLMAHEFAHHWWGDNTTCRTQEDMWLNEGWASYSEKLFLEHIYGKKRYDEAIMDNHFEVLRRAHLTDGQPRAVSGVPHAYTYGDHVYKKGASVVHSLRGYMGDADFMAGIKAFQNTKKLSDVSSEDLKNVLQAYTSANLTSFFDNWVYTAGFPAFSAYITNTVQNGSNYTCTAKVNQQLRFTNKIYKDVPLVITFISDKGDVYNLPIKLNLADTQVIATMPFAPKMVVTDRDARLCDAVTENEYWVKNSTAYDFNWAMASVSVNAGSVTDSTLMRIEHHWTAPVNGNIPYPNLHASGSRYWRISGTWNDTLLSASVLLQYDGSTPGGFTSGWLDNDLIKTTEDSLVLLYRPDPRSAWVIYPHYTKTMGNKADKRGNITLSGIKKGEYVFAMFDKTLGGITNPEKIKDGKLNIYPNPTDGQVKIEFDDVYSKQQLLITDNAGRKVKEVVLYPGQNFVEVDTEEWAAGIYYVNLGKHLSKKLVVK